MKKLLQGALLPFTIFAAGLSLLGCDQMQHEEQEQAVLTEPSGTRPAESGPQLSSGNLFYMARDVADMQYKTHDDLTQLQHTQRELQQAIDQKDRQQLQATARLLHDQLSGFNHSLSDLKLKSQEIDTIRQHILDANQQALASPLFNGEVDFSKIDFNKIQVQISSIQTEMVKLASLIIPASESAHSASTDRQSS